jgi:hypothetical protein
MLSKAAALPDILPPKYMYEGTMDKTSMQLNGRMMKTSLHHGARVRVDVSALRCCF